LRRCRYARDILLLGEEEWSGYKERARELLALRFVFFQRPLDFHSEGDFETVGGAISENGSGGAAAFWEGDSVVT
jgi:hypothetical protein